jgi:hypothetical protein
VSVARFTPRTTSGRGVAGTEESSESSNHTPARVALPGLKESQLPQTWEDSLELSIGIMCEPIRQTHSHNGVLGTQDSGRTPTPTTDLHNVWITRQTTLALSGTVADGKQVSRLSTTMPNSHKILLPTTHIQDYSARWRAASLSEL